MSYYMSVYAYGFRGVLIKPRLKVIGAERAITAKFRSISTRSKFVNLFAINMGSDREKVIE